MDADAEFRKLAGRVGQQGPIEITPRQLSRLVGKERRGARIVAEIRSRLARYKLETDPDFADVHADAAVRIVPGTDHRLLYLDQLLEAAQRIANGDAPLQVSVRTMLEWFGAERRGTQISELIRATLSGFDLETRPDFESVHADALVSLVQSAPAKSPDDPPPAADAGPSETSPSPAAPSSAQQSAIASTFRIGTLAEARRPVISISPQRTLREAMSVMLCERISHLPVMANERSVKGLVRWKDVGRFLLLETGTDLEKPVERVMVPAVVVPIERPFLEAVSDIIEHGCVLVRDDQNRICGVVTTKDLGRQLEHLAAPFVTLGEIERGLRVLIEQGEFTVEELRRLALDPADPREVASVADLTLGEMQRLLERDDAWQRIELPLGKRAFIDRLGGVRRLRNAVMHFDPDSPTDRERRELQKFLDLMYEIRRHLTE